MAINKIFNNSNIDDLADNVLSEVDDFMLSVEKMQKRKVAGNVQLVIQALKKIESDIRERYDSLTTGIEKRVSTIKDGRDGTNGKDGRDGKDGRNGKDGAIGSRGLDGAQGIDGRDGEDGVSVVDAQIDFDGSLIISLSSGRVINVGEVVSPDLAERIKVITSGGGTSQDALNAISALQSAVTVIQGQIVVIQADIAALQASAGSEVAQSDIGSSPNEIPLNQYLGNLAYQDAANIAGNVGVGGNLTVTNGAVIQGLTVGLGAGAVSTNTAVGLTALNANTGGLNVAVGYESLITGTATTLSVAVGYRALNASTGDRNVAVGAFSMDATVGSSDCVAVGRNTLRSLVSNGSCTAIGTNALTLATGQYNTALGYGGGENITSGAGNIAFSGYTSSGTNAPAFNITTENNRISMGSTSVTNAYIQVAWTTVSDTRDKTDFAPIPHGLEFVSKLQPTAYRYKETREAVEGHGPVRYGFKAQDVLELEGDFPVIVNAEDSNKLRFNDQSLLAVLVNAVKELKAEFDAYKAAHP